MNDKPQSSKRKKAIRRLKSIDKRIERLERLIKNTPTDSEQEEIFRRDVSSHLIIARGHVFKWRGDISK